MRVEARWITQVDAAQNQPLSTFLRKGNPEPPQWLRQFEDRFFAHLETSVPNARTVAFYKEAWKPIADSKLGAQYITRITPAMIEEFVQGRSKEVGPARINASLRTLRKAMRLSKEWGVVKDIPKIKMMKGERQREFIISEDLLVKILAHKRCTAMLRTLLPFLVDTGLRISELCSLTWDRVGLNPKKDSSLGWVYIDKGKTKYAKRHIPLTERARDILEKMKKESKSPFVFPAAGGGQLSRHWASEQFRTLRDAMELPDDCVVHSTRHTFCTRLGESGVGAFEIQKLAGHSSIVISQRYVHPTPEVLEGAIGKLMRLGQ
jgi:integrase